MLQRRETVFGAVGQASRGPTIRHRVLLSICYTPQDSILVLLLDSGASVPRSVGGLKRRLR